MARLYSFMHSENRFRSYYCFIYFVILGRSLQDQHVNNFCVALEPSRTFFSF